ncbi:hypothetical protein COLO4_13103 [Corchorus olitorius]|uniref:Uncharacterized protein n=1 Tax=Corchorus olitorius TaxID=93759 RepID=A0A1R3JY67_9ROSI|nr:hypothetical protein COLO4_13103 [Corchorus olitorius]
MKVRGPVLNRCGLYHATEQRRRLNRAWWRVDATR